MSVPSEHDALLAAICEDPGDDTPRLAFADWLDEHDSPHWAALIRTECELARLAEDGSGAEAVFRFFEDRDEQAFRGVRWNRADPDVGRRVDLALRANRLRAKAGKAMRAALPDARRCGVEWWPHTRRGFPAEARVRDPDRLAAAAPELLRRCPPVTLAFQNTLGGTPGIGRKVAAAGLLRWADGLNLPYGSLAIVADLSQSPDAAGVREFWQQEATDTLALAPRWLAATANWAGLRSLALGGGELGREPAAVLLQAKHLHRLARLRLRGAGWTRYTIRPLNLFTELRELELRGCGLGDDAAEALANMPGLASLRSLSLRENRVTGRGTTALLTSPHLAGLAFLDLENNPVRGLDRKALAAAPPGGLRGVGFHGCRLGVNDVAAVVTAPRLANLVYLDLDYNPFPESAVARLVKGFGTRRPPAVLYLMGNRIATAGAKALAGWEGAAGIDMLHLRGNPLTAAGAKALAASPHLGGLRHLCAGHIPRAAATHLRNRFGKKADVW